MNERRYRAWRFYHPDIDTGAGTAGLSISSTGGIEMVEESACVRQAIFLLLSTRVGERVMRPDYGCELNRLIFSPNDDTTAGLAIHYVEQALARWEPRIDIVRLNAGREEAEPERLYIELDYRVRATRRNEHLEFTFNLAGG